MDERKLQKLEKLLDVIDSDMASSAEVTQLFEALLSIIKDSTDRLENRLSLTENSIVENENLINSKSDIVESSLLEKLYGMRREFEQKLSEIKLRHGEDGIDGKDGQDANEELIISKVLQKIPEPDLSKLDEAIKKLEQVEKKFVPWDNKRIDDIERMAKSNSMPVTTSFFNGLRGKNLNIVGGIATQSGDTINVTVSSGGGHTIEDEGTPLTQRTSLNFVGAGVTAADIGGKTTVTIPGTAGSSFLTATGTVNGSNTAFTFTVAPSMISIDNRLIQKTSSDMTINWTGTTSVTLIVAPNFDIFGII